MNEDYTADIPPIEGAMTMDEIMDEQQQEVGCECEIDWKCGVCRENGYRHSRLDACGLGPDAVLGDYDELDWAS